MAGPGGHSQHGGVALLPQVDGVQIRLEDALLAVSALQQQGDGDFPHLSSPGALPGEEETAGELLGDGAGAAYHVPLARVREGGPRDGEEVDAQVKPEAAILGRDHRGHHGRRDPIQREPDLIASVHPVKGRDLAAVRVQVHDGPARVASIGQGIGPPAPGQREDGGAGHDRKAKQGEVSNSHSHGLFQGKTGAGRAQRQV